MIAIICSWLAIGVISFLAALGEEFEGGFMPMHELAVVGLLCLAFGPLMYPVVWLRMR